MIIQPMYINSLGNMNSHFSVMSSTNELILVGTNNFTQTDISQVLEKISIN